MLYALVIFIVSLLAIAALFTLKYWELRTGRTLLPSLRVKADEQALRLKELLIAALLDLAKLPPNALRLSRYLVHEAALGLAALARIGERQAHRLADTVSYKHRFERRETRSEFLKKVAEGKHGGDEVDASEVNGHNT